MSDYDVFICYRRAGGEALSQLLYERLTRDGYRVFYDVETMRSGKFNEQILQHISESKAVLVVLPPHALDRCMEEDDWVRQEIAHALEQKKLLIPILMRGFEWPDELPPDIQELPDYQGIAANDFSVFDTWYERLKGYINEVIDKVPKSIGRDLQPLEDQVSYVRFCLEIGSFAEADEVLEELLQDKPKNAELWLLKAMAVERVNQEEEFAKLMHPLEENKAFMQAIRFGDSTMRARLKDLVLKVRETLSLVEARETKRKAFRTIGAHVAFGTYPQSSECRDKTPIEWIVLDVQGNKSMLISRYGLDVVSYHHAGSDSITWEKCTLRAWLNENFISEAFTSAERKVILQTSIDNSKSQGVGIWKIDGGNNTQDKVFLLSYAEANKYFEVASDFKENEEARTAPTPYAIKQGAFLDKELTTTNGEAAGTWWLRSPGGVRGFVSRVYCNGALSQTSSDQMNVCVRPAMWINLDSDILKY